MNKNLILLATCALAATSIGCRQLQARMEIDDANTAYRQEQYDKALEHYLAAHQLDASFVELDRMIGYSYIGLFEPENATPANQQIADQAIQRLERYVAARPEDIPARETLVGLYLSAERTDQAINFFKKHLEKNPKDLETAKSIATLYAKKGDFAEALNWYKQVTILDPRSPEAFYIYGVVLYEKVAKKPDLDEAANIRYIEEGTAALTRAAELRKDYFEALVYTNLLYRERAERETDPDIQAEFLAKADEYRNQAVAIAKARKAAETKPSGAA